MIPWILHSVNPVIYKKLNQKPVEIFCSSSNNDLLRVYLHGAKFPQILCDCLAKL